MAEMMARRRGLNPGARIQETTCTQEKLCGPGSSLLCRAHAGGTCGRVTLLAWMQVTVGITGGCVPGTPAQRAPRCPSPDDTVIRAYK